MVEWVFHILTTRSHQFIKENLYFREWDFFFLSFVDLLSVFDTLKFHQQNFSQNKNQTKKIEIRIQVPLTQSHIRILKHTNVLELFSSWRTAQIIIKKKKHFCVENVLSVTVFYLFGAHLSACGHRRWRTLL